jgi:hypothetical protein
MLEFVTSSYEGYRSFHTPHKMHTMSETQG